MKMGKIFIEIFKEYFILKKLTKEKIKMEVCYEKDVSVFKFNVMFC